MHLIIGGTMGNVAGSPNDPIFFNHHTMIDCLLERWLERQPTLNYPELPGQQKSAFAGHGPGDCLVPFIPLYTNNDMFKLSTEFGYTCDLTLQEPATSQSPPPSDGSQSTPDSSQGTPDSSQGIPDSSQGTPDSSQGTPDSSQGTPDSSQGTPDSSQQTPDSSQETPNGHQGTTPGQSTNGASHNNVDSAVFAMLALAFSFVALNI